MHLGLISEVAFMRDVLTSGMAFMRGVLTSRVAFMRDVLTSRVAFMRDVLTSGMGVPLYPLLGEEAQEVSLIERVSEKFFF